MATVIDAMAGRLTAIAPIMLLLAACNEESPPVADPKQVIACMSAQQTSDDYLLVTKCEPLGPKNKFEGTWVVGFETSLFTTAHHKLNLKDQKVTDKFSTIIVPAKFRRRIHSQDPARYITYRVVFVGRESLMLPKEGHQIIVMDEIISMEPMNSGF
jgi:hypothetical protein